jgi:exodeoxyribonuclease V alpha subunit
MTIHKSQGSQFDHAVVLLPPKDSDFVTKDLIYTGITRAKKKVTIVGQRPIFEKSIRRQLSRASGLRKRFWG